ncbi:hypothetical protein E2I00_009821 [Balaenoptera physalus]|uniref:Uncharacterized protein n=1 Tax=Balaenoptera physalus TaxID=9770 RepID=A0A643C9J9_BALPH|nr:hypothetical protein E2I00_009821 [Balaenoptera physalus]
MGTPGEGLGRCSHALIRGVPESLASGEGAGAGLPALDLAKAQREHGVLGGKLRQRLGLQLLELPPEESLPLGPLLGDTAVIQGDTALITRPWSPARRPEVDGVRKALQDLGLRIVEMGDENATLDGTDVLFTGREFFAMAVLTDHPYASLTLPDDAAADCLFLRPGLPGMPPFLLHRGGGDLPNSQEVREGRSSTTTTNQRNGAQASLALQKLSDVTLVPVSCSELEKAGAGLSSLCLVLSTRPHS